MVYFLDRDISPLTITDSATCTSGNVGRFNPVSFISTTSLLNARNEKLNEILHEAKPRVQHLISSSLSLINESDNIRTKSALTFNNEYTA